MARLIVKLHGTELTTLNLDPAQEYIAGRAPDAHIRLSEERGISRHHLKFYQREGGWVCEALSKFVPIQLGKQSVEVLELNETTTFSLPPFEFHFEADARPEPIKEEASVEDSGPAENKEPSKNLPTFYQPRVNSNASAASSSSEMSEDTSPKANNEATVAGVQTLIPYFRVSYPNTADDEVLKLEGHIWTGGRESDCEIFVDSPHISRRHFEVSRTKEGFFITDLGSSNGTKVNGVRLPPHEPTEIESGDEITIMNIRMSFEIRDTHFANRLESLPVQAFDPMLAAPVHWSQPQEFMALPAAYAEAEPSQLPTHWKDFRPHHLKYVNWKKNKIRVLLLALLPVLLIGIFQKPKSKQPERAPGSDNSVSFDALAPERKNVVKDSFNLARNLYVQGKYALCLTELAKVHEIIPQFENSKELQSFCDQGLELVRRQEDIDRKERERIMIEQQITGFVDGCKQKLSATSTVDETKMCLSDAMVLAPDHPLVIEMINNAQMHEEEVKFNRDLKAKEDAAMQKGFAHFRKANDVYASGNLAQAIAEFEKYINASYPRNAEKKGEARRKLASIKQELKGKVGKLLDECKALGSKNKYKDAYISCNAAVQGDPKATDAKAMRDKMLKELRKEMKAIYEDSVLEESLGNVESAKEKWKKIMSEDLDFDDYSIKAKSKLQKYGAGG